MQGGFSFIVLLILPCKFKSENTIHIFYINFLIIILQYIDIVFVS